MERIKLVIADDNATFIDVVSRYVGNEDRLEIVGTASDGSSAVDLVQRKKPDLVMLDLGMPGLTGIEVLPLLRVAKPDVRVIILTLLDTEAYRSAALRAGADAFISKAALSKNLLPKIYELLEQSRGAGAPTPEKPL